MRLALAPKLEASMPSRSGCQQWRTPPWSPGERAVRASLFTERAIAIPAHVLADRDRRLSVEPTVYMRLLGDPVGRARENGDEPRRGTLAVVPRHGAVFSACAVRGVDDGCWRPAPPAA